MYKRQELDGAEKKRAQQEYPTKHLLVPHKDIGSGTDNHQCATDKKNNTLYQGQFFHLIEITLSYNSKLSAMSFPIAGQTSLVFIRRLLVGTQHEDVFVVSFHEISFSGNAFDRLWIAANLL